MRSLKFGFAALTISAGLIMACNAQPPADRKGPPPQWNPVHLFPPDIRESLNLSDQQEKQIDALEKEVRGKVDKILTAQQRKILGQARPRGPGGPGGPGGPDGPGGPPDGPGGRPGRGGQRQGPGGPGGPGEPPPPGGPKDFDGPPPPPSGPREWEQAVDSLTLSDRQREKLDEVFVMMHEKLRKQNEQAQADLLKQMKQALTGRQFQQFEHALQEEAPRPPRGPGLE
jgi:Spy/CpxP family protein refolding chaperone